MQNTAYYIGAPWTFQEDLNAGSAFSIVRLQLGLEVVWKKKKRKLKSSH